MNEEESMWEKFLSFNPSVQAAIISAIVGLMAGFLGAFIKPLLDKKFLRDKLTLEYEFNERKKLRELIGKYHGRILEASERLNHRLWNLQVNETKGWLFVDGIYDKPNENYYYTSTLYRFVELYCLLHLFRTKAIFIDARYSKEGEIIFLKFAKALEWVITDVDLFKGLKYDSNTQKDHIFRDKLQLLCETCIINNDIITIGEFNKILECSDDRILRPFLGFFDGLDAKEDRFRWDRIIAFHLLLMAFINKFGYDIQKSTDLQLLEIAKSCNNRPILLNLALWLPKLGIEKETRNITKAIGFINDKNSKLKQIYQSL